MRVPEPLRFDLPDRRVGDVPVEVALLKMATFGLMISALLGGLLYGQTAWLLDLVGLELTSPLQAIAVASCGYLPGLLASAWTSGRWSDRHPRPDGALVGVGFGVLLAVLVIALYWQVPAIDDPNFFEDLVVLPLVYSAWPFVVAGLFGLQLFFAGVLPGEDLVRLREQPRDLYAAWLLGAAAAWTAVCWWVLHWMAAHAGVVLGIGLVLAAWPLLLVALSAASASGLSPLFQVFYLNEMGRAWRAGRRDAQRDAQRESRR